MDHRIDEPRTDEQSDGYASSNYWHHEEVIQADEVPRDGSFNFRFDFSSVTTGTIYLVEVHDSPSFESIETGVVVVGNETDLFLDLVDSNLVIGVNQPLPPEVRTRPTIDRVPSADQNVSVTLYYDRDQDMKFDAGDRTYLRNGTVVTDDTVTATATPEQAPEGTNTSPKSSATDGPGFSLLGALVALVLAGIRHRERDG